MKEEDKAKLVPWTEKEYAIDVERALKRCIGNREQRRRLERKERKRKQR